MATGLPDPGRLEPGRQLYDGALDRALRVTYVSDEAVVVTTPTGMLALPREWVEAQLADGPLSAV